MYFMSSVQIKSLLVLLNFILPGLTFLARSQVPVYDSIPQIGLPEVEVSAMRLPFKESSVPYSISLIDTRNNTKGLSLSENLATLPGLQVNARYNYAVGDRITNRGFGARTQFGVRGIKIVFDDIPVTFADGQTNLDMIDLQNLSYVEFLRGPGSSIYGNSSGGVLLIHGRDISENSFISSVSSTFASNGLFRWSGLVEGRNGKTALSLNYTEFHYNGFREHASADHNRIFFKSLTDLSSKDKIQIEGGYVKFNALNPGSLTKTESIEEPGIANPSSITNGAEQNGEQVQVSGTWKHLENDRTGFRVSLFGIHRSVLNPIIGKVVVLPQYSGGLVASYNSEIKFLGKMIRWSAGSETGLRFNERKNYTNINGSEGDLIINQNEKIIGSGLFLQGLFPFTERLNLDACLRYDLNYFGVVNKLGGSTASGNRVMKSLNPSIGFIYKILKDFRFFANVTTSFETPTSTELVNRPDGAGGFNPELNPSHAIEYETGIRGHLNTGITYDLTAYLIHTSDELIPFQVESAPGQDYFRNAGSTIRKGGELTFRFRPVSILELISVLTYIDAYYKDFTVKGDDYSGKKIPGVNRFHYASELKLHKKDGLFFSIMMENFGKMYVDDSNSENTKIYALVDLGLGHEGLKFGRQWMKSLILSGGISNLFNIKHITAVTVNAAASRYYEPGPGRTFYVNARFGFGRK